MESIAIDKALAKASGFRPADVDQEMVRASPVGEKRLGGRDFLLPSLAPHGAHDQPVLFSFSLRLAFPSFGSFHFFLLPTPPCP